MRNFVQDGARLSYTAAADIDSGDVVVFGARVGIATANILNGETGVLATEGVYTLPKKSGDTFALGAVAYWDATNGYLTSTTTSNTLAGYCYEAAGSSATTMKLKINA